MMCRSTFKTFLWLAVLLLCAAHRAAAHENRPLFIEINEFAPHQYIVTAKLPPSLIQDNEPTLIMPNVCQQRKGQRDFYDCTEDLAGKQLSIRYPHSKPIISTLIRWNRQSGESTSIVLAPQVSHWTFPAPETKSGVAKQYTLMGIEHILAGIDHLFFLVGLLLIARTRNRILVAVTGFTIAHSITLILSALNILRLPVAPVEAAIALSIVFVAVEIARGNKDTITYRHPSAVTGTFGLLHGFGFAAVLQEIGLPQKELATGLLFFNVGVEIGQLIFVGTIVALMLALRQVSRIGYEQIFERERAIAYGLGILSSWWMIERVVNYL